MQKQRIRRLACTCPNCQEGGKHTDNNKKQHICHIDGCNKVYGKTSHLRAHIRWHTGERPYVCTWFQCGKKFSRSDELHRHTRTHTGEKKFICKHCYKKFMRSDHLSKHVKTHEKSRKGTLAINEFSTDDTEEEDMDDHRGGILIIPKNIAKCNATKLRFEQQAHPEIEVDPISFVKVESDTEFDSNESKSFTRENNNEEMNESVAFTGHFLNETEEKYVDQPSSLENTRSDSFQSVEDYESMVCVKLEVDETCDINTNTVFAEQSDEEPFALKDKNFVHQSINKGKIKQRQELFPKCIEHIKIELPEDMLEKRILQNDVGES